MSHSPAQPRDILLLISNLEAGGTERQVTEIARGLRGSRYRPHVACFQDIGIRKQELEAAGVPILVLGVNSLINSSVLIGYKRLRAYIRRQAIRIVHAFDMPTDIFAAGAGRAARVPLVLASQRGERYFIAPRQQMLLRWVADPLAHGWIANCEAMRRHLVLDFGIPETRVRVCPNGIDTTVFSRGGRETAPERPPVVGIVSVLRPEKGLLTLVEGFAAVARDFPGAGFRIVGSGPMEAEIRAKAAELGIGGRLSMLPATREVAARLREIDVFVLPSLSEALSNALMEAMACACCCVASNVGGNPELVKDGETGLLFEPGDAAGLGRQLVRVLGDVALRRRLAEAAHDRIHSEYTLQRSVERMAAIYDEFWTRIVATRDNGV